MSAGFVKGLKNFFSTSFIPEGYKTMASKDDPLPNPLSLHPDPNPAWALPPDRVRDLDRFAIQDLGIPGPVLMENASKAVAALVERVAAPSSKVVILAGKGNNGGDGMAAHRHLHPRTRLLLLGDPERLSGDAALQWSILQKAGLDPGWAQELQPLEEILASLSQEDLVVDALFGTGLSRPVGPPYAGAVAAINACPARVLAVDIPSGLDAREGKILGSAVKADWTVTFAAPKTGFYRGEGPERCGRIYLAGIGIPAAALETFLARGE